MNRLPAHDDAARAEFALAGTRLGLWDWNLKTGETSFNERWAEIVGYTLAELEPVSIDTWASLAHPDDLARSEAAIADHIEGRAPYYDVEVRMRHKDGHWVWVHDRGALFERTADGEPLRMVGTHEDITGRVLADQALAESEQRFASMFSQHSAVMLLVEPASGTIIDANFAAAEYYGYPVTTLRGMPIEHINMLPPDEIARRRTHALRGGGDFVFPHRLANGEIRTVEVLSSPIFVNEQRLLFSIITDITEREEAVAELAATATTFESIPEVLFVTDAHGVVLRVNAALTDRLGWLPDDVIGGPANRLAGESARAGEAGFLDAVQHGDHGPFRLEGPVRHADGSETPALVTISAIEGIQGEVTGFITLISDLADHVRAEQEHLERAANVDPLTGLPNRAHFTRLLGERLAHRPIDAGLAVICLDLDRFKVINDSYGHAVGDALLQTAAQRLATRLRPGCVLSRFGGNEFSILAADVASVEEATARAQALVDALAPPFHLQDGGDVFVTACAGVTVVPRGVISAEEALHLADAALHEAKEAGASTVRNHSGDRVAQSRERLLTESRLQHAWANDEIAVHYQPQVDIATGQVVGVEALVRWLPPGHDPISASEFISVAERIGLIKDIDAWALHEACSQGIRWDAEGLPPLRLSVNVTATELAAGRMADTVAEVLADTGFPAERLMLELTESTLLQTGDATSALLDAVHAHGVGLAIDDFGTGYSSFAYLQRFPLAQLKIDRSFVNDVDVSAEDLSICRAVIRLGHAFGLSVIAEGVERRGQLDVLTGLGCDQFQGFLVGPALPADELASLVRARL